MSTQKCWECGKQFSVLEDEVGLHGCPNRLCKNYDKVECEFEEDEDIE